MALFKAKVKKIGNGLWVIIPKRVAKKEKLQEGEGVKVSLRRNQEGF